MFWFILCTATLTDIILKMAGMVPCPRYKLCSVYRLKPRPLRKAWRLLLLWFRLTFPLSPPDLHPLFLPLARCFLLQPSWLSVSGIHHAHSCHRLKPSASSDKTVLALPSLAYAPFFLQPPMWASIGSPSWQPPRWISHLLIHSFKTLNGLLVLTVSLLKKLQQEC